MPGEPGKRTDFHPCTVDRIITITGTAIGLSKNGDLFRKKSLFLLASFWLGGGVGFGPKWGVTVMRRLDFYPCTLDRLTHVVYHYRYSFGVAWPGPAWPVLAWPGLAGPAWPGLAWPGLAWPGLARPGPAGLARWLALLAGCPGLAGVLRDLATWLAREG